MIYRIKSVPVLRSAAMLASLVATVYVALFIVLLVALAVGTIIGRWPAAGQGIPALPWAWFALPVLPFVIFTFVWLMFLPLMGLLCFCYNLAVKVTGGIEFSTDS